MRALLLLLACALLLLPGCNTAAQRRKTEEVVRAAQAAKEAAVARKQAEAQAQALAEAQARLSDRLQRFATAVDKAAPVLAILERWDLHGDTPCDPVLDVVKVVPRLLEVRPLAELCERELREIARQTDDIGQTVHGRCRLAVRAKDVLERQYIASVRHHLAFPENLREAAKRYRQHGRVGWHQVDELARLDEEIALRKAELRPLAVIVGLPVLDEPFRAGVVARRELQVAMRQGLQTLTLPEGVTDTVFEAQVRAGLAEVPEDVGPMPGQRSPVLKVQAVDVAWQVQAVDRKPTRRDRRAVALVPTRDPGVCAVLWLRLEQAAIRTGWARPRAVLDDDVRWIRCPRK
jgi:hypothetical protein